MHAQIMCDAKGDTLRTIRLPGIRSTYIRFKPGTVRLGYIPALCLYGALATKAMFGDSCSKYSGCDTLSLQN